MATYTAQNIDTSNIVGTFSILDWKPLPGLKWMQSNWQWSIYFSFIYLLVIFSLKRKMQDRAPYKLQRCLAIWNSSLSIFSIFGAIVMIPEMVDVLVNNSFHHSVCYSSTVEKAQYWMWLFAMSKIIELGDTLFIVLRKQNLIFLHYCHHVSALVYTWYSVSQNISLGRWFVTMNYSVHSLMYGYYTLRALQYRVPRFIAMLITTLQIVQMVFGFYVSYYAFRAKLSSEYCEIPMRTATLGFLVYVAFFYMFAQFFVKSYLPSRRKKRLEMNGHSSANLSTSASIDCKLIASSNSNGSTCSNGTSRSVSNSNSNGYCNGSNSNGLGNGNGEKKLQ